MCDPVSLTAAALMAAGTGANAYADGKARKSAKKTMDANTAAQGAQFDRRMGYTRDSDKRVMDLLQRQYGDTSALEDTTFDFVLDQSKQRADSVDLAARGLITETQKNANSRVALRGAEAARQSGYLDKIAANIATAANDVGFAGQQGYAADALTGRMGVMDKAIGPASESMATPTADALVQGAMASRAGAARDAGMKQGAALSKVGSYEDASSWADQLQKAAFDRSDTIKGRADLSQAFSGREVGAVDASDELALHHADFAKGLAEWLESQRVGAQGDYATKTAGDLDSYYGRSFGSEADFTQGMVGSSQHLEDTNTNLANYVIGNTSANHTFGDLLKTAGNAVGGMDGSSFSKLGGAFKGAGSPLTRPGNSAIMTRTAPKAFGGYPLTAFG